MFPGVWVCLGVYLGQSWGSLRQLGPLGYVWAYFKFGLSIMSLGKCSMKCFRWHVLQVLIGFSFG